MKMAKNQVVAHDVKMTIKDITSNMSVVTALLGRKQFAPEEYRRINQAMGGAATLVSKGVAFARKLGESTSEELVDRLDDKLAELFEEDDCEEGHRWCPNEMKCIPDE